MLRELFSMIREFVVRIATSRLFALSCFFAALFMVLAVRLFNLQIVNGENYLRDYQGRTLRKVTTQGTRGNIYDRDGKLLAYNELQYNITISDNDAYNSDSAGINSRNRMLMKLASIIEKYGYSIDGQYKVTLDENGEFSFTTRSEEEKNHFVADLRGKDLKSLSRRDLSITAKEAVNISRSRYRFDNIRDDQGNAIVVPDSTLLDMINILFTLRQTAYQRYQTTTIVKNVSSECAAEILESKGELAGVDIDNVSVRRYNYAPYVSHIVGYTGQVREDQLEELKKQDPSYELNDTVGVWGLEKSEESVLKGQKGQREMYLNSVGSILQVISETEAKAGNDIYTTISANDQIAIYHLLEQELAGILSAKITESDSAEAQNGNVEQSQIMIPVKDAYFQLINNNVLDTAHFSSPDAGSAEQQIASIFSANKEAKIAALQEELQNGTGTLSDLPQDMQAYVVYIYDYLTGKSGILNLDDEKFKSSDAFTAWKNDSISMHDFLLTGISEDWIDTSRISPEEEYSDTESIFNRFVESIIETLRNDSGFDKILYRYAIADKVLPGHLLMMALFEQGVLAEDNASYSQLATGDEHFAYTFLVSKIRKIELTPAQLALDPCNGSVVVTDVHTGKVRALVTYPGFDNNQISNADYLAKCNQDLSLPLLNCATQTQLAPGSTFKPITSIAALEEGVIDTSTIITCTGKYEEVTPNIRCWIWPSHHGPENIVDAIKNSCNFFFADLGHQLSMDKDGNYDQELGLSRIAKYASIFGLNEKTGLELDEASPRISDTDPERSAMGQGNHAYNNVQLARYITAVANNGMLYNLSILDRITDSDGNVISTIDPKVESTLQFSSSTWDAVHTGLREVITEGVAAKVFRGQDIEVAGKTGTAQEREDRGNHAVFVSYAPYNNPQISVTVNIPYGYSSGNAANLADQVYNYCFGKLSLDQILAQDGSSFGSVNVSD